MKIFCVILADFLLRVHKMGRIPNRVLYYTFTLTATRNCNVTGGREGANEKGEPVMTRDDRENSALRGIHTTYDNVRRRFDVSADFETYSISAAFTLPYGNALCCRFVANGGVEYDHVLIIIFI